MLYIEKIDGRIAVTGNTYPARDALKALPGRKWEADQKHWSFPYTASSLEMLMAIFPAAEVRSTLVDLKRKIMVLASAMEAKTNDNLPSPASQTEAWNHQKQAFWFAHHRLEAQGGAMLALDMGTGKSKVAIDLINAFDCKRVLITCPTSVMDVWPEEFKIHSLVPRYPFVCPRKKLVAKRWEVAEDAMEENFGCGTIIINHEALWRKGFGEHAMAYPWDMIIVDESHRAKSAGGKLSRWLGRFTRTNPNVYRLALTGTPTPHSIDDLYGQARFIDPSVHGTNHQVYKSQYLTFGGYGMYQVVGYKNTDEWHEKFHSMAIQVKADDVLDLPEAVHVNRYCELDAPERGVYEQMKHEFVADVKGGVITAANALVQLLRMAQIIQGTTTDTMDRPLLVGNSKSRLLDEVVGDIDPNEPVVVFCRFKCDLENIRFYVGNRPTYELSGRKKELQEWKAACAKGHGAVLAVQLQAGGVGISMVQAKYCIYLSKDFSLGNYEQSLARVQRPGQNRNVTYIHLVAKDTIDVEINKALANRKDTVESIIAGVYGSKGE